VVVVVGVGSGRVAGWHGSGWLTVWQWWWVGVGSVAWQWLGVDSVAWQWIRVAVWHGGGLEWQSGMAVAGWCVVDWVVAQLWVRIGRILKPSNIYYTCAGLKLRL
jgi:hypothetical protein